jgi:hypothetical protein
MARCQMIRTSAEELERVPGERGFEPGAHIDLEHVA